MYNLLEVADQMDDLLKSPDAQFYSKSEWYI